MRLSQELVLSASEATHGAVKGIRGLWEHGIRFLWFTVASVYQNELLDRKGHSAVIWFSIGATRSSSPLFQSLATRSLLCSVDLCRVRRNFPVGSHHTAAVGYAMRIRRPRWSSQRKAYGRSPQVDSGLLRDASYPLMDISRFQQKLECSGLYLEIDVPPLLVSRTPKSLRTYFISHAASWYAPIPPTSSRHHNRHPNSSHVCPGALAPVAFSIRAASRATLARDQSSRKHS